MIGEVGWPSAGRMRAGALPSPADQARVMADVLERAKRERFHVNVIEAFDQPWKRALEGTVGGHWGLFDDGARARKFVWGEPVSNHPYWPWQAIGGVLLAGLVFAAAAWRRAAFEKTNIQVWGAIVVCAVVGGVLAGWAVEIVPVESLGAGGWMRSLAFAALAIAVPIVGAAALSGFVAPPAFASMLGPKPDRVREAFPLLLGILLLGLAVLAVQSALALAFDPRYRDFPFAPLTAAAVPFALNAWIVPRTAGRRMLAETLAAAVLILSAAFIAWNETLANWQALWFCGALVLVAFSLLRARVAPD
jgi:glucan 1,3-beta-glucosidase